MTAEKPRPGRCRRISIGAVVFLVVAYVALLIPEGKFQPPTGAGKRLFVWNTNQLWAALEQDFLAARKSDPMVVSNRLNLLLAQARKSLEEIGSNPLPPGHTAFAVFEIDLFKIAPLAGASPERVPEFANLVQDARAITKRQSEGWDLKDQKARDQLYRILFGGRMALEIVMVQIPKGAVLPPACADEPSSTPAVTVGGITFHSGDILVSRGWAPTSSLISRGNDYPGNYSHVAILHVAEGTGEAMVVESLIERGVIIVPFAEFMAEKRLRLMALRLRSDLPALRADPQAPHRAATLALKSARQGHTPYDFAMDFRDPSAKFCSEVVSRAYEETGIHLWMGMSHISSETLTAWLASVGVRHFETQEPSDLEYDPQLRVVAEWRNSTNLFQAHLDDAVTDSMVEAARPGAPLKYNLLKLPFARVTKGYCAILNAVGKTGKIPEGMSATEALRASQFREEHRHRKESLAKVAAEFQVRNGYQPPYWELLRLATERNRN